MTHHFSSKINWRISFVFACCFIASQSFGQKNFKKIKPYAWMVGVHWNIIDDNGDRYGSLFDVQNAWNILPYPTALNIDYYFMKGFSAEVLFSYNRYDSAKVINGVTGITGGVITADFNAKYSIGFLMEQQVFDPFIYLGLGYTNRAGLDDFRNMFGMNIGAGFNIMVWRGLGLQWRTTGKIGILPDFYTVEGDYLQHHFGLIYKIPDMSGNSNPFAKPKYGWTKKTPRYRSGRKM
jgi:hypothetical protein